MLNQIRLAQLFATSKPNISIHISNILKEKELQKDSVVKDYLTTAADGKQYSLTYYSLDMILAIGFWVRSKRSTQFRIWAMQEKVLQEYEQFDAKRKGYEAKVADEIDFEELEREIKDRK